MSEARIELRGVRVLRDPSMRGKRYGLKAGGVVRVSPAVYSLLETDYALTAKSLKVAEVTAGGRRWL